MLMMDTPVMEQPSQPQEQFQTWLAHMDDYLEELRTVIPAELAEQLDFSVESLGPLEKHLLSLYASIDEAKAKSAAATINLFSIYVGETIRKNGGGKWTLEADDPDYAYYNLPIIKGFGKNGANTDCPLTLVTAATDRRKGDFIKTVVQYGLE